ncbi:hypothetical protein BDF22DRAFT_754383 [Syncephalis plumigaleata]|nr:hypothetical protein BDF22DRAFT_754383 [Syncephalis plumigaleata]
MPFGQVVIGPPGSGKTTYCYGMQQFLTGMKRDVAVINLDPANDNIPYDCALDISELITLMTRCNRLNLYLLTNFDWLVEKLKALGDRYYVFDFPGQVELYTHDNTKHNYRLAAVHLVDAHYCTDPAKFNLDFYTQVMDLSYLMQQLDESPLTAKYRRLNEALCELVEDFGLVGFQPLCIEDKMSVANVVQAVDKANGYVFGGLELANESIFEVAARVDHGADIVERMQAQYIDNDGQAPQLPDLEIKEHMPTSAPDAI